MDISSRIFIVNCKIPKGIANSEHGMFRSMPIPMLCEDTSIVRVRGWQLNTHAWTNLEGELYFT